MADALVAAQHVVVWHLVVGVGHLDGLEALVAQFVDLLGDGDPLEGLTRFLLDKEAGDATVRSTGHQHDQ